MNEQERLAALKRAIGSLDNIDEQSFDRIMNSLPGAEQPFGFDRDGRLRVAVFDAKSYDRQALERANSSRINWHFIPASLTVDTVGAAEHCRAICIFVNDSCDAAVVHALAARGVELIALRCAGYNNVDLQACQEHGISVVRVPAYSPYAVAEHAVALMLMLNRKLHRAYLRNRAGYFVLDGLTGFDMRGKTVGVVGTGTIGKCLIDILLGFGCQVVAFDKFPDEQLQQRDQVRYTSLAELLSESDIVSLHVPLFDETRYLINEESIRQMKHGAMLINTSRGALVDSRALINGLKSGRIGSAGLDVYEEEAGVFFHDRSEDILTDDVLARLMTFSNVVITSHQAFLTREALDEIATVTCNNVHQFLDGKRASELDNSVLPSR